MTMTRRRLLDDTFKKSVVGNPAIATDSLARMYPGIEMQGWTEQESTTGAQLGNLNELVSVYGNNYFEKLEAYQVIENTIHVTNNTVNYMPGFKIDINTEQDYMYVSYKSDIEENYTYYTYIFTDDTRSSNTGLFGTNVSIPLTSDDGKSIKSIIIGIGNYRDGTSYILSDIMINYGSTPLSWEPYTGGQPSPSPDYPQEIVSSGLWDETAQKWEYEIEVGRGQLAEDSVVSHPEGEYVPDKIIFSGNITGEYTISLEEVGEVSYAQPGAGIIKITINGKGETIGKYQLPYTFSGNITEITVFSSDSYIMFTGTIKFMLNPGSTPLPYAPYRTPQTVTLTADRPLTKWDKLEKRNGQWGWVYKSAEIESYTDESVPGEYYSTTGQLSVGAQVWYETTTETFVPLTASEQEAMNALYTYRPTTVLSNQQDCQMMLTYKSRKGMS